MRKVYVFSLFLLFVALMLSSCSVTRHVPDDQYLLNSVRIETEDPIHSSYKRELYDYLRQVPNARWFSLFRLPLGVYSMSGADSTLWSNRLLRSMGESPVIYSHDLTMRTSNDLRQALCNKGYLGASVTTSVSRKDKRLNLTYHLHLGRPYLLGDIKYVIEDSLIARFLEEQSDITHRLLHTGMQFDVDCLDAERKRLAELLTNHGYYRFHKEYITYQADTVGGTYLVDLTLVLSMNRRNNRPDTLHTKYSMRRISYANGDNSEDRLRLRRKVLEECTHLHEGDLYSAKSLRETYNHLGRLQAVRYTNISMHEVPDSALLDCMIQIQTNKQQMISFQPEGTNTSGDFGAAATLTYQNRNLFHGSEVFSLELRGAYEAIRGLEGYANQDFIEYSVTGRLSFPRFVAPFLSKNLRQKIDATSELSLRYDLQDRPEFHRRVLSTVWRYKWSLPHRHDRFQFDLLDLNYVFMPWIAETFKTQYLESTSQRNAILRYNYEDLFITKIGLGYSYSRGGVALKVNVETSGNLLNLGSHLFGASRDSLGYYRLFNIAYAQYAKADIDLTRSFRIDQNSQLVLHAGVGVAFPYGNSTVLPFEKRYFSGGANSVRGWSVRTLGPGSYKEKDGLINFINQTGDMKLDLNAEYRTHLFWKIGGAIFVDAGNIWTVREYEDQPGGQFRLNTFLSQLAVSYGLGFRLNFDYFILRFDLGMKAVNPSYKTDMSPHYPLVKPSFSRDFAFHFAVGMPF